MTFGPYGKDVPLREFMQEAWDRLNETYPENPRSVVLQASGV